MPKAFQHVCKLDEQTRVPYSAKPRANRGRWAVVFPDATGKRVQLSTEFEIRGKTPPQEFHDEAHRLIKHHYRPLTLFPSLERKGWDELLTEVETKYPQTRPETFRSFRAGVKAFRETLPDVKSPLDISDHFARQFAILFLAQPSKKGKGGGRRSPTTLSYYLRALSAWSNKLVELGHLTRNPWHGIKAPRAEKKAVAVPTEDTADHFFGWVSTRYPTWTSLHALLNLKAVSASRTADLCQIKSAQLRDGSLTFTPDQTKTKTGRAVPLPDDLFQTLQKLAGPVWLWEGEFWEGIKAHRKLSNGLPSTFKWQTVYYIVNNIFREYRETFPDKPPLRPHDFRRRAITLTVQATGSVDAAATALGLHAQTARNHYLDAQRAFQTAETMKRVAEALKLKGPKRDQTDNGTNENAEKKPIQNTD